MNLLTFKHRIALRRATRSSSIVALILLTWWTATCFPSKRLLAQTSIQSLGYLQPSQSEFGFGNFGSTCPSGVCPQQIYRPPGFSNAMQSLSVVGEEYTPIPGTPSLTPSPFSERFYSPIPQPSTTGQTSTLAFSTIICLVVYTFHALKDV